MSNMIGGLVAVVVTGAVIMIISRLGTQAQELSVTATQQRAIRTSEMDLVAMIDMDFQNIGSNFPEYPNYPNYYEFFPDSAISRWDTVSSTREFTYRGQTKRGMPPDIVSYTWTTTGTKTIERGTVDIYQVQRWINGQLTGSSTGAITRFSIVLLDSGGNRVATPKNARQILVSVSMVSGLGESSLLGETHWKSIVRPAALARMDYENFL